MKYYFLTDESEKSLAPFFSGRVLDAVMVSAVTVGAVLLIFFSRRPLSDIIATGNQPTLFFLVLAAALIAISYVNLSCGGGDMVRRGYYMINYRYDIPTHEKEIAFYRYGLIEFLFHALVLLLPLLPFLSLAAFSSAVSVQNFLLGVAVLYVTSVFCRLSGFLVYLSWGRASTLGYFAARALMIFFVIASIVIVPAINPLHILYLLNQGPERIGHPLGIFMASAVFAILVLTLLCNAMVRRYINKEKGKRPELKG
jgi:hypothetical protein